MSRRIACGLMLLFKIAIDVPFAQKVRSVISNLYPQLVHTYLSMRIIRTNDAVEHIGDEIQIIPLAKHRSRRVWKKLRQRRMRQATPMNRPACYEVGNVLFMHPAMEAQLQRELIHRNEQMMTEAFYGLR
ncbi:MAG: hypothetical protein ACR2P3_00280 [Geminicoccaceae bacterium]